ncbi:MAG: ABC transporter substrate-binding protein [Actinomycetia bacterium]|nr:ABC transporter substrate-binding protein [Actinomycetes bacterium]
MRRMVILAASFVVLVVACTSSSGDTTTTAGLQPQATTTAPVVSTTVAPVTTTTEAPDGFGGGVTIGVDFPSETLNPFSPDAFGIHMYGNLVWATVYDIDPDTWDRIPDVIEAMPSKSDGITVNDDGTMTVMYKIVDQAMWSDGEPITGADLALTAEAMRDMAVAGEGGVDPVMATVIGTEADSKSASITFSEPTLAFEDALWIILPSHALEGVDLVDGTDGTEWPSGGPFVLEGEANFDELRFVRNENYWKSVDGRALPYLDAVTILATTEPGSQGDEPVSPIGAFVAHVVDVAPIPPVPLEYDHIESAVTEGAEFHYVPTPIIEHLTFNFSDARFETNPDSVNEFIDFRRALAASINRPQILDETGVAWFPETPGMLIPVGESVWSVYEVGIAQIPELPEGATSTLGTTCEGDSRYRIKDALEPAFTAAGVMYEPECLDSSVFFGETIVEGTYDIGMWAWVSDGGYASQLRVLELFDPRSVPPEEGFFDGGNYGRWGSGGTANNSTVRFSEIVDEAKATLDPVAFFDLVREAEAILATELPIIPLSSRGSGLAIWPDAVTGVTANGSRSTFTWNIELWQRPGK